MKHLSVALLLLLWGLNSFAQESFKELNKKGNEALNKADYETALTYFTKAVKVGTDDQSNLAWTAAIAGICAHELSKTDEAMQLFSKAIQNKTTDVDIYQRQITLTSKKHPKLYEEVLQLGRKNLPQFNASYTSKLMYLYLKQKQYDKAVTTADELLKLKPGKTKALYIKAVALIGLKKYTEAETIFKSIIEKEPTNHKALTQYGLLLNNLATVKFETAKAKYNKLAKPTRMDYAKYKKETKLSYPAYNKAIDILLKAYAVKSSAAVKKALFTAYTRTEQKEKANKYK
ncbi:tetratricopeptide repeat protein [Prolixibacteraceae bacterium JC049]|nr:tetratricopeptide repeat protein [Prolixibacteraceae bacterium JC049]